MVTSVRLGISTVTDAAVPIGLTIRDIFDESSDDNPGRIGNSPNTRINRKCLSKLVRFEDSHNQSETSRDEGSSCNTRDGSDNEERVSIR